MVLYMPVYDCAACGAHPYGAPSPASPPMLASRMKGRHLVTRMILQDTGKRLCCPWCWKPFPTKQ